ncbi:MAG: YgaP family membrane protein [Flavobacteriales bacterium]
MKANMGSTDKIIRIILALVFIVLFYMNVVTAPMSYVLLALSAVFVLTSLVSFCPMYPLFGINTCKKQ